MFQDKQGLQINKICYYKLTFNFLRFIAISPISPLLQIAEIWLASAVNMQDKLTSLMEVFLYYKD